MEFNWEPGCVCFRNFCAFTEMGLGAWIQKYSGTAFQLWHIFAHLGAQLGPILMEKDRDVFKGLLWPFPLQRSGWVGINDKGWKSRPGGDTWSPFLQQIWQGSWCVVRRGPPVLGGQGGGHWVPRSHRAIFGRQALAECSPRLQGAAPGARRRHPSGAKCRRLTPSPGGKASPSRLLSQKVEGTARVSLASRPSGSRAEGDTTGSRAEGGRDQSWVPARGHRQERSGRKGLVGEGAHGGWGRRSACVLGGRPEVWGRQGSSSAGSCQRLQAALSPPPSALSPVRSRARAARGEGRRRREQPVV